MDTILGSSATVPCVQELAKEALTTVPPRYLWPDQETIIASKTSLSTEIPIVNFQKLLSGESDDLELQKLHSACKEWGFFQLTNHGISSTLMENVKQEIKDLFGLPMEEKMKLWQEPENLQGFGQLFVLSEEQSLNWSDIFFMVAQPAHMRNQNLFSKLPISFRDAMVSYSAEVKKIAMKLLKQMEKALKIRGPEEFTGLFDEEGYQGMRINYYPPCPQPDLVMGINPHSDACGLTILLQHNEVEGLQIKKDGKWVMVKPLPNAFVINIGDILQIATNGIYKSVQHRAVVNLEKERISFAAFHSPNMGRILGPATSLITPETPALFKSVGVEDYFQTFFSHELKDKSNLDNYRIQPEERGVN